MLCDEFVWLLLSLFLSRFLAENTLLPDSEKKLFKKLNNNIAKQSQTYANLHSIEYVFVFTLTHYYDAFWEW